MLGALRVKVSQGRQYILDLRKAVPHGFAGRPVVMAGATDEVREYMAAYARRITKS